MPGAHILGLLLNPRDTLGVWVQIQSIFEQLVGKGVKLFKPDNGDILKAEARALLLEFVINLAAAQNNLVHSLIAVHEWLGNDPPESTHGTLLQSRDRFRMTQKALGRQHHQGLSPPA